MIVSPAFAGKRYAVLGLARSGLTAVETLLASGAHVMAWDAREEPRQALCTGRDSRGDRDRIELADPVTADITGYDGVIVSPGVPLNKHPIAEAARRQGVPVIGDIELFALARQSLPAHRVVGITGTNGKSTTTSLVHHLLENAGVPARVGGNIGVPVLGEQPLPEGGVYVLELSSYQIDLTRSLNCDVAALLNITPDHLDRYDGFEAYAASKARLFEMQGAERPAVFGTGDRETADIAETESRRRAPGTVRRVNGQDIVALQKDWPSLQGPHNLQNAAVAVAIVQALGISEQDWQAGLRTFSGLPHRMERVAEAGGVLYINDSKATNPASTAPALAAFPPDPAPRIHWILGGLPKGDDLDECAPYFGNVAAAYTIGDAGPRFAEILAPYTEVHRSEMMAEAIRAAMTCAVPGDVIMLSPACASFDQFRDYEARGLAFRQIVEALLESQGSDAEGMKH
ncbi:MAG: UDP-N-acetylmuramoyl-L-alanine--D-glutamate ligase [Novosphingobium pentaromativorans]|uniref:UDP-N-acetylmuramoylalanine--D-glutamate ligase n=1 Tax=Novosphingobium pentaromativorans TaxID=205844 RepID=A0A2W5NTK7_9SPHN|nr:MAG: UDP-N-acetylmuramoyl-L-alanine--D-glutamate ligase [Novosphingobium pentaromativorans]